MPFLPSFVLSLILNTIVFCGCFNSKYPIIFDDGFLSVSFLLNDLFKNLKFTIELVFKNANEELHGLSKFLNKKSLENFIKDNKKTLLMLAKNLQYFAYNIIKEKNVTIDNYFLRLDNLNIQKVLKRGFAIVRDAKDKKIVKTSNVNKEHLVNIEFYDGILTAKTQKKQ